MLADTPVIARTGHLLPEVHLPKTAKYEILDFIAEELPKWRDDKDRPQETAETILTSHLSAHLNTAAHISIAWSGRIQFSVEDTDDSKRNRKIDLVVKPCASVLFIEGRKHTHFSMLFPIECKRLPTPKGNDRDEREYVVTNPGTTGGIQRFKFGYHGADHTIGAMIAYVQDNTSNHWLSQINTWIEKLSEEEDSAWKLADKLDVIADDPKIEICKLRSKHERNSVLEEIELRHLWIIMS